MKGLKDELLPPRVRPMTHVELVQAIHRASDLSWQAYLQDEVPICGFAADTTFLLDEISTQLTDWGYCRKEVDEGTTYDFDPDCADLETLGLPVEEEHGSLYDFIEELKRARA